MDAQSESSDIPPAPASRSPSRVLVVEDDEEMRDALREFLLLSGFLVSAVGDGQEADVLATRQDFDVLLCDIRLPGLDGISLARRVRMRSRPPHVILLTAYPEWKVYDEATGVGVAAVITKPVNLQELAKMVESIARTPRTAA